LLPPGAHRAEFSDVEAAFVNDRCGDVRLRIAVYAGIRSWVHHARAVLGPGTCWISGGFVSRSEPEDTALAAFEPRDRTLARVATSGSAIDLHNLTDVLYASPSPGGTLRQRWAVSGLVDAHLVDEVTRRAYLTGFAAVLGPNGFPEPGTTKGYVEVEIP
jgi:hypothetical protein